MRSAFALRIISGRTILNFGVQKRLRAFLNPIFTDGVVTENGICSAAFCESAALRASACSPEGELARPQRRAFAESSAANAVCRYDPSREKAILENPQIFQNCEIINILSAEHGHSFR